MVKQFQFLTRIIPFTCQNEETCVLNLQLVIDRSSRRFEMAATWDVCSWENYAPGCIYLSPYYCVYEFFCPHVSSRQQTEQPHVAKDSSQWWFSLLHLVRLEKKNLIQNDSVQSASLITDRCSECLEWFSVSVLFMSWQASAEEQ